MSVGALRSDSITRPWDLPNGARLVIAFEFCERVGFYSMVSLLALFLAADRSAGGFGWSRAAALTLLGAYSGLMYALPVAGGWVADRLLGHRRALSVGGGLLLGGYLLLTLAVLLTRGTAIQLPLGLWHLPQQLAPDMARTYGLVSAGFWGSICALVVGNSLVKSTLVVALGDSFSGEDARRETAYAYYYAGINLGGLVAGLIAGSTAAAYGWAPAFAVSALAMGIALAAYLTFGRRYLRGRSAEYVQAPVAEHVQVSGAEHVQVSGAEHAQAPPPPVAAQEAESFGAGTRLFILSVFAALLLIYSIGSFQLWGTMSLFLERVVDRRAGSFEIPTQWFTSVEAAALILAAPAFATSGRGLRVATASPTSWSDALALSLGAAGLMLFAVAAWPRAGSIRPGWWLPALGIWIQATGEVAAWTVTYGLVYRLAPRRMVAAIMGAFYATTLGLGAYLAGWLGTFAEQWGAGRYFLILGSATAAAAIIALVIRTPLRTLAAGSGVALHVRTG